MPRYRVTTESGTFLLETDAEINGFYSPDNNLEAVFNYLVQG